MSRQERPKLPAPPILARPMLIFGRSFLQINPSYDGLKGCRRQGCDRLLTRYKTCSPLASLDLRGDSNWGASTRELINRLRHIAQTNGHALPWELSAPLLVVCLPIERVCGSGPAGAEDRSMPLSPGSVAPTMAPDRYHAHSRHTGGGS